MRHIAIILISLALLSNARAQTLSAPLETSDTTAWVALNNVHYRLLPMYSVESKMDTTIIAQGDTACIHDWAVRERVLSDTPCYKFHGPVGCPRRWRNDLVICVRCLRYLRIKESRSLKPPVDKFSEALKRLEP